MSETLKQEFDRLIASYMTADEWDASKAEGWNLIADFAIENADYLSAALSGTREAGEPSTTANCYVCGRIVDTREKSEGGDPFGAQDSDGWTCSIECWETTLGEDAAPPAEVERGAVTDEMVEAAMNIAPIPGRGPSVFGAERMKQALEAALASSAPTPQPAVEAQGVERWDEKYDPDQDMNYLVRAEEGGWVRFTDHQRSLASEKARADRLEQALADVSRQMGDAEAELAKLRKALDAAHFYIDASVTELGDMGISRDEALAIARALRPTTSEEGKAG